MKRPRQDRFLCHRTFTLGSRHRPCPAAAAAAAAAEPLERRAMLAANLLDPGFGGGDGAATADFADRNDAAFAVLLLPGGKVLAAGSAGRPSGPGAAVNNDFALARFLPDGRPDSSFTADGMVATDFEGTGGDDAVLALAALPDGKVLAAGFATSGAGEGANVNFALARYTASGALDTTFGGGDGRVTADFAGGADRAHAVAVLPDGDILVAGTAAAGPGDDAPTRFAAVRYNADGTPDAAFGPGGEEGDGKILDDVGAVGDDGSTDADAAMAMALLPGGKFLLAGTSGGNLALARYGADGALDPTFGPGGADGDGVVVTDAGRDDDRARAVAVLPDGDILVAGSSAYAGYYSYASDMIVARYNADGRPEAAFGGGDGLAAPFSNAEARALAPLPGGQFLTAGRVGDSLAVARFNPDGSPDPAFDGEDGLYIPGVGNAADALAIGTDGRAVAAGRAPSGSGNDFLLLRLKQQPPQGADPTDQLFEAEAVPVGSSRDRVIDPTTDVDMFKFTVAAAGRRVSFDVDRRAGSGLDPVLRLFDGNGNQLAANDDAPAPGEAAGTSESYLTYFFPGAGTYFVGVSGSPNASYSAASGTGDIAGSTGAYRLTLRDVPIPADGNDQIAEAVSVSVGSAPRAGTISPDTDVDLYKFTIAAVGQRVGFDVDHGPVGPGGLDALLRVFDAQGQEIARADSGPAPGEAPDLQGEPYVEVTFAAAGTYYVGVSPSQNTGYDPATGTGDAPGGTGPYTLQLVDIPADGNDQISEAAAIGVGSTRAGTVSPGSDVDMYRFDLPAGQEVAIDLDRAGASSLVGRLRLFAADGTELASSSFTAGPGEPPGTPEAYLQFLAEQAGTFYLGVSSADNASYDAMTGEGDYPFGFGNKGSYAVTLTALPADPDDQITEAVPAAVGVGAAGAVDSTVDVDLFKVTAQGGQRLAIDVDVPAGGLNPLLRVFNADGSELATSDDGPAPGEPASTRESFIEYVFPIAGDYYVGVSGSGNGGYNPANGSGDRPGATTGQYTLSLADTTPPDDGDVDDQVAEAAALEDGVRREGVLAAGDVDMYSFTAAAGEGVLLELDQSRVDAHLRLFDASGAELAESDGGFFFQAEREGAYYVGVSGSGNFDYHPLNGRYDNQESAAGAYALTLFRGGGAADEDDQISEARPVETGQAVQARIEPDLDVDMYSFEAAAGQTLGIDTDLAESEPHTRLRLFAADGTELAASTHTPAPDEPEDRGESYIEFTFEQAGTYYVGVSTEDNGSYDPVGGGDDGFSGRPAGAYTLTIKAPPADPDDQIAEAPALAAGQSRSDQVESARDVDLYAVQAVAGQVLSFDVDTAAGSNRYFVLRLFDQSGKELASAQDNRGPGEVHNQDPYLEFAFASAGTYYVGVSSNENRSYDPVTGGNDHPFGNTGEYQLTVGAVPPDPTDQISEAAAIAIGSSRSGTITPFTDVDMFKFTVRAGQRVALDVDLPDGSDLDPLLRLFDASGSELSANDDAAAPGEAAGAESYLEYVFNRAGTYYVAVSGHDNGGYNPVTGTGDLGTTTGAYTLRLRTLT